MKRITHAFWDSGSPHVLHGVLRHGCHGLHRGQVLTGGSVHKAGRGGGRCLCGPCETTDKLKVRNTVHYTGILERNRNIVCVFKAEQWAHLSVRQYNSLFRMRCFLGWRIEQGVQFLIIKEAYHEKQTALFMIFKKKYCTLNFFYTLPFEFVCNINENTICT